ncbi:DinB family protein [Pedobacter soli]|uniref:DinB superfamily protein n=1 Tax=Pedobacter soli TaxID=390242 RepID=A0A1G6ISQ3_9SPHI|nr:DinB family protein [Pedobacter soli]SDC09602.1 DinB superfamily protein [Pedobacter soli]
MTNKIQESLWRQFGASIDMLINVISNCPVDFFLDNKRFYYLVYHSVVFLDYYSTIPPRPFSPILSFTIQPPNQRPKESIGDMIPDKIYSKQELLDYLQATRLKCKKLVDSLTDNEKLDIRFTEGNQEGDMDYPILEILLYNLRHTQHHIGQLNLIMRQDLGKYMEWAFRVDELN